jgi:hypothetical protein
MDETLRLLVSTVDEDERESLLHDLIFVQSAPLVRRTIRYRLRSHFGRAGGGLQNPDAEDLFSNIVVKLIARVELLRASNEASRAVSAKPQERESEANLQNGKPRKSASGIDESRTHESGIDHFRQYVLRVASNACHDFLRAKYPARARLKDSLRDLLERHPDFAIWKGNDGELYASFVDLRYRELDRMSIDNSLQLLSEPSVLTDELGRLGSREIRRTAFVAHILRRVGGSIEFDTLVTLLGAVSGVRDQPVVALDSEEHRLHSALIESPVRCETRIEARETLEILWKVLSDFSYQQRAAYFLGFRDSRGEDLLTLLMDANVVHPSLIASKFGWSLDYLMTVWKQMPLDSASIGELLSTTRQNVNKLRYRTMKRLSAALAEAHIKK